MAVSKKDVKTFFDYCLKARSVYQHSRILFEYSDARKDLLAKTAQIFFGDLNSILIEYNILQVCKLTDGPETRVRGKARKNLTIKYFLENGDFSKDKAALKELKSIWKRMEKFRKKLKPARDRLISHLDHRASTGSRSLGAAPLEQWKQFWKDLDRFLFVLYKRYVREEIHLNEVAYLSDVDGLIRALKQSCHFETALNDNETARKCAVLMSTQLLDA